MGQVPHDPILIIGRGRVARHFAHYFSLERRPYLIWSRSDDLSFNLSSNQENNRSFHLQQIASAVQNVLLLISDPAIETFYLQHDWLREKTCVHFSGSLVLRSIPGAHPLMTFADQLYDLQTYRQIPFVIDDSGASFESLLPGLVNPVFRIDPSRKPLYHALCVLSGNFSILLWEKTFAEFSNQLGLPKEVLIPYMKQVFTNLVSSSPSQSVLTGPLKRSDQTTIEKHLAALDGDAYAEVYRAFVKAYESSSNGPYPHREIAR